MTYRRLRPSTVVAGLCAAACVAVPASTATAAPAAAPTAAPTAASATDPAFSWTADLSTIDHDDVNVTYRDGSLRLASLAGRAPGARPPAAVVEGLLTLAGHELARPVDQVRVDVTADAGRGVVEVALRGAGTQGWSEWHRPPAGGVVFDPPVSTVQVRVRLAVTATPDRAAVGDGTPQVTAVTLTAEPQASSTR